MIVEEGKEGAWRRWIALPPLLLPRSHLEPTQTLPSMTRDSARNGEELGESNCSKYVEECFERFD